jgi:outer membrane immunogenic protein
MYVKMTVAAVLCLGSLCYGSSPLMAQTTSGTIVNPYDGAYVGLEVGGALGSSRKNFSQGTTTGEFDVSGVVGGVEAGYGWVVNNFVIGVEGDISGTGVDGTAHAPNPAFTYETANHWLATVRPRLGYLLGSTALPYLTGGLAIGDLEVRSFNTATGLNGVDFTRVEPGWVVGAGFETGLFS